VPKSWAQPPPNPFAQDLVQRSRHCSHQRCSICPTRDLVWPEEVIRPTPSHAGAHTTLVVGASPVRCIFSVHLSSACLEPRASPCPRPLRLTTLAPANAKMAHDAVHKEWLHPPDSRGPSCPHISGICHCRNDPVPAPPNQTLVKKLPTKHRWKNDCPIRDVPQTKPMHLTLPTR